MASVWPQIVQGSGRRRFRILQFRCGQTRRKHRKYAADNLFGVDSRVAMHAVMDAIEKCRSAAKSCARAGMPALIIEPAQQGRQLRPDTDRFVPLQRVPERMQRRQQNVINFISIVPVQMPLEVTDPLLGRIHRIGQFFDFGHGRRSVMLRFSLNNTAGRCLDLTKINSGRKVNFQPRLYQLQPLPLSDVGGAGSEKLIKINATLGWPVHQDFKEKMMVVQSRTGGVDPAMATRIDLLRLVGDVDERKIIDILALHPTIAEIEEASLFAAGNGDILARGGHPLSGIAAEVLEILTAGEEEEEPPSIR